MMTANFTREDARALALKMRSFGKPWYDHCEGIEQKEMWNLLGSLTRIQKLWLSDELALIDNKEA